MSDVQRPDDDDPGARLFRAALPGWQSVMSRPYGEGTPRDRGEILFAPGRGWLELSVLSCAVGLLVPVFAFAAVAFALRARSAGNSRWLAALIAAAWCGLLGGILRFALGAGMVP